MQTESPQDKVHICRGLSSSSDITISLYFKALKQVQVYSASLSMGSDLEFTGPVATYDNVDCFESIDYSKVTDEYASYGKMVSRNTLKKHTGKQAQVCKELEYLKKRLSGLKSESVIFDSNSRTLTILAGGCVKLR